MNDEELLTQINALDPLPGHLLSAARAAFAFRLPNAVLADLTIDQDAASAGIRGEARLLTFVGTDGPAVGVEIEVTGPSDRLELTGQTDRPGPAEITLRSPSGGLTGRTDRDGRFLLGPVPCGLVSLVFTWPDATSIATSWVRL